MVPITLAEHRCPEQTARMTQVTEQAAAAWKQKAHSGWYAANLDSQPLLHWLQDLLRQQVGSPFCLLNAGSVPVECMFSHCTLIVQALVSTC